jgi:hypothetical protein
LSFGIVRQQRVLQRVLAIAGARMYHHPGRLVDHQYGRVLVHDVERQFFGRDRGFSGSRASTTAASPPTTTSRPRAASPFTRTAPSSIQRWMRVREYCGRSCANA